MAQIKPKVFSQASLLAKKMWKHFINPSIYLIFAPDFKNPTRIIMPKISVRGHEMPASPIRKLAPLANDAKSRGIHVYHLNIGQPDLPTPTAALDAIRGIDRTILEYSPSQGYKS